MADDFLSSERPHENWGIRRGGADQMLAGQSTILSTTARGRYWCPVVGWTNVIAGDSACNNADHKGPCADGNGADCSLPMGSCDICTSSSAAAQNGSEATP